MPYVARKQGDKYVVFKKKADGTPGERVGATAGNKEALRKYLAALHIHANESIKTENTQYMAKHIKLASLINLKEGEEKLEKMTTEEKKAFLEAVSRFAEMAPSIYRNHPLKEISESLGNLVEAAKHLTLTETEDWFDNVTVGRHMKQLEESFKLFEKTASELSTLQQRLESVYEEIGSNLGRYYNINEMISEAGENDYQKFFQKSMKKFKISEPGDLETPQAKRKFFNYVDKNYKAKDEPKKEAPKQEPKEEPKKEEPKKEEK
jgi:hypothetical protein